MRARTSATGAQRPASTSAMPRTVLTINSMSCASRHGTEGVCAALVVAGDLVSMAHSISHCGFLRQEPFSDSDDTAMKAEAGYGIGMCYRGGKQSSRGVWAAAEGG